MKRIKERLKSFQRLGLLAAGIAVLLGVSQAGPVQRMLTGSTESKVSKQLTPTTKAAPAANNAVVASTEQTSTDEVSSGAPNIVDLIGDSETIIRGSVKDVTDGFENGIPYTQVTVEVSETLRGQVGSEYTFRQFGLTKPRSMGDGRVYLGVSPEGWSRYAVGENTMLFLFKRASMTGLQTTVGLGQGKIMFEGGNAISQAGNEGLLENVEVNANLLNDKDKRLLSTRRGAVNADGFLSFVRRAVQNRWIEGGKMRHAKK